MSKSRKDSFKGDAAKHIPEPEVEIDPDTDNTNPDIELPETEMPLDEGEDETLTLLSITVTPANATIDLCKTQQYKATATYSDGSTKDVSSKVTWSVDTPTLAGISNKGLVTPNLKNSANNIVMGVTAKIGSTTGDAIFNLRRNTNYYILPKASVQTVEATPTRKAEAENTTLLVMYKGDSLINDNVNVVKFAAGQHSADFSDLTFMSKEATRAPTATEKTQYKTATGADMDTCTIVQEIKWKYKANYTDRVTQYTNQLIQYRYNNYATGTVSIAPVNYTILMKLNGNANPQVFCNGTQTYPCGQ